MPKRTTVKCPYCHSLAVKRPASFIYKEKNRDQDTYVYVCSRNPFCDAYVAAHKKTGLPMGTLANGADILTPNLTEAAIILGREWQGADVDEPTVREMILELRERGAKNVVLKGIEHGDGLIHNYVWGDAIDFTETTNAKLPYMLHGTGDVFASTLLAAVMAGRDLAEATAFAADFTADAMLISAKQPNFEDRGVSFEPLLGKVTALLG